MVCSSFICFYHELFPTTCTVVSYLKIAAYLMKYDFSAERFETTDIRLVGSLASSISQDAYVHLNDLQKGTCTSAFNLLPVVIFKIY